MSSDPQVAPAALLALRRRSPTLAALAESVDQPLRDAVVGYYLIFRAIDDIEDEGQAPPDQRIATLRELSAAIIDDDMGRVDRLAAESGAGPVAEGLARWYDSVPQELRSQILCVSSVLADRLASWTERGSSLPTERHLNLYVQDVAGRLGVAITYLWQWSLGLQIDDRTAGGFATYLEAVDLAFDREEDLDRGVDLYPRGWGLPEMMDYAAMWRPIALEYLAAVEGTPAAPLCNAIFALFERRATWVADIAAADPRRPLGGRPRH